MTWMSWPYQFVSTITVYAWHDRDGSLRDVYELSIDGQLFPSDEIIQETILCEFDEDGKLKKWSSRLEGVRDQLVAFQKECLMNVKW